MTSPDGNSSEDVRRDARGQRPAGARADQRGARDGHGAAVAALRLPDPVPRGGRRPVRARRLLRARDADRRPRHGRRDGACCGRCSPRPACETIGKFLMGTVKGDVHDIGKNLVNIMLEGAGFEVIDLGVQVAAGEVRRGDRGAPARHRRLLGVPHHHDADVQGQHERPGEGRHPRQRHRDGRRCPGHPGVRRRGRRRRLRRRRLATVKKAKALLHEKRRKVPA